MSVVPLSALTASLAPPGDAAPVPPLLAMDTATEQVHLALLTVAACHVQALPGGAQASAALLPATEALLAQAGCAWPQVAAIACGVGPGAFTGLRTACAVAQGLALGLGCPTIAIDTLMAVAEDARQRRATGATAADTLADGTLVWVLQDARMGELYAASYRWQAGGWRAVDVPALWPKDEPARRWAGAPVGSVALVGNALAVYAEAWAAWLPALGGWQDAAAQPAGAALAALARQAWLSGQAMDPALLLPRYVRDKVAQTTEERMQARQAGG